jgi:hypothetical protein
MVRSNNFTVLQLVLDPEQISVGAAGKATGNLPVRQQLRRGVFYAHHFDPLDC